MGWVGIPRFDSFVAPVTGSSEVVEGQRHDGHSGQGEKGQISQTAARSCEQNSTCTWSAAICNRFSFGTDCGLILSRHFSFCPAQRLFTLWRENSPTVLTISSPAIRRIKSNISCTARGVTPGCVGVPIIVCVLPDPVCPYAKIVELYLSAKARSRGGLTNINGTQDEVGRQICGNIQTHTIGAKYFYPAFLPVNPLFKLRASTKAGRRHKLRIVIFFPTALSLFSVMRLPLVLAADRSVVSLIFCKGGLNLLCVSSVIVPVNKMTSLKASVGSPVNRRQHEGASNLVKRGLRRLRVEDLVERERLCKSKTNGQQAEEGAEIQVSVQVEVRNVARAHTY